MATKSFNYSYNGFNQLQRVQTLDNRFIDYTYNGTGLQTKNDFGDSATNYYYNGSNIILKTDKDNAVTARNIRSFKMIYRENNPGQVGAQMLFYLHNAHGDVTQLLDEKGQLIKDYQGDILQKGSEDTPYSHDVEMLQRRLVALKLLTMPKGVNYGYFGRLTEAAVNIYKDKHGLWNFGQYAGKVGETTWKHLGLPVNSSTITDDHATNRKGGSKPVKENDSITATTPQKSNNNDSTLNTVPLSIAVNKCYKGWLKSNGTCWCRICTR